MRIFSPLILIFSATTLWGSSACEKSTTEAPAASAPTTSPKGIAPLSPATKAPATKAPAIQPAPKPEQVISYDDHNAFWTAFQSAVTSGDAQLVSEFIQFPFHIQAEERASSTAEYDNAAFLQLWPKLLAADPGMTVDPTTMQTMVINTLSIPEIALQSQQGNGFRIGNFEFAKGAEGWKLTSAYFVSTE